MELDSNQAFGKLERGTDGAWPNKSCKIMDRKEPSLPPYEKLVLEREGGVLWDGSPPGFQVMEPG